MALVAAEWAFLRNLFVAAVKLVSEGKNLVAREHPTISRIQRLLILGVVKAVGAAALRRAPFLLVHTTGHALEARAGRVHAIAKGLVRACRVAAGALGFDNTWCAFEEGVASAHKESDC